MQQFFWKSPRRHDPCENAPFQSYKKLPGSARGNLKVRVMVVEPVEWRAQPTRALLWTSRGQRMLHHHLQLSPGISMSDPQPDLSWALPRLRRCLGAS